MGREYISHKLFLISYYGNRAIVSIYIKLSQMLLGLIIKSPCIASELNISRMPRPSGSPNGPLSEQPKHTSLTTFISGVNSFVNVFYSHIYCEFHITCHFLSQASAGGAKTAHPMPITWMSHVSVMIRDETLYSVNRTHTAGTADHVRDN